MNPTCVIALVTLSRWETPPAAAWLSSLCFEFSKLCSVHIVLTTPNRVVHKTMYNLATSLRDGGALLCPAVACNNWHRENTARMVLQSKGDTLSACMCLSFCSAKCSLYPLESIHGPIKEFCKSSPHCPACYSICSSASKCLFTLEGDTTGIRNFMIRCRNSVKSGAVGISLSNRYYVHVLSSGDMHQVALII